MASSVVAIKLVCFVCEREAVRVVSRCAHLWYSYNVVVPPPPPLPQPNWPGSFMWANFVLVFLLRHFSPLNPKRD